MKFITEEELRDIYRKTPFTTYEIEEGTRLTPGARQFLADRGMSMFDDVQFTNYSPNQEGQSSGENTKNTCDVAPQKECLKKRKLLVRLKVLHAKVLQNMKKSDGDFFALQVLATIAKKLALLGKYVDTGELASNLNEKHDPTDDIEISEVHLQMPRSELLFELNLLNNELSEMCLDIVIAIKLGTLKETNLEIVENSFVCMQNKVKELMLQIVGGNR